MVRLAKSIPKYIPRPKPIVPPEVVNQEAQIALLKSIDEKLTPKPEEPEEKEEVEEVKEPMQVNVLNFPDFPAPIEHKCEMKECVHKEVVVNVPERVKVDELPLAEGASTEAGQATIADTLERIEAIVEKLKFNRDGELKTTGSGGYGAGGVRSSLLPADASTASKQDIQTTALNSILSALEATLDVAVTNTVTVQATNLDVRDLAFATDKVDASGSEVHCPAYIIKYDDAGSGITYVGRAVAGTSTGSASWQIYRVDESASPDFDVLYADGVTTFTKTWTSRASYSYS